MNQVDSYILKQNSEVAKTISILRSLILNASPIITEKISYKVPFYYAHFMLCYINPTKHGVDLGFCKGFELSNAQGLLEAKDRNTVKTITFQSVSEIDENVIREIINEAVLLDEIKKK